MKEVAASRFSCEPMTLPIDDQPPVDALLQIPPAARACFVFGHGAGAGMTHPFMAAVAEGLCERGIACLRYQFPSMQRGSRQPDPPAVAHAAVRAAVAAARHRCPALAIIAGGKSFGGRMTSQAQAAEAMPGVVGLAFLGFPLHPAGKPADDRARHLSAVGCPMLFLQGTRDALAELDLLQPVVDRLGTHATLVLVDDADHSFHVPKRSDKTDAQVLTTLLDAFSEWIGKRSAAGPVS